MRALRVLLVIVVILGGLFVAADRIAVNFAEDKAADKIRSSQGLDRTPEVSITGFPFLTQVAGRSLDQVDAKIDGLNATAEGHTLRIQELSAQFHDVKLTSDYTSIERAASATGEARISYADLTTASGKNVKVSYGGEKNGKSQVKISPNLPNLPMLNSLEVTGSVSIVNGDTVRLRADTLPALCSQLSACRNQVRAQTDHEWKLNRLPGGLKLDKVVSTREGISISASGKDVKLPG
ncbi:LmeA family phospholipid-binding protein [Streptomyces chrestomyceticus]|uniref:Secreted protein n=1 Tax=Streptomyces chrestomyceticus JCM 4735 TaxID=1306181 RepID=A0A7U9Q0Y0_9ACTN|nr:DUF2993 domain-containing protein [Streptomyces chrestomyceticus]GCD35769.1 hypothetical protein OEIGOIKO_03516 [Streptomyces chrestomyceticus JCM 4735]